MSVYASHGLCEGLPSGTTNGFNYTDEKELTDEMRKFWKRDWAIQVHANGNQAMNRTLGAFKTLQLERLYQCIKTDGEKAKGNKKPLVLIHATVGHTALSSERPIENIKKLMVQSNINHPCFLDSSFERDGSTRYFDGALDISVSHTAAHTAYWGGAFENILDGNAQSYTDAKYPNDPYSAFTASVVPTKTDLDNGVPLSLNSDAPITPANPLWYVEQVVTRNTWYYPKLGDEDVLDMPGADEQKIDVYTALKGITIVPAQQNQLDKHIGSIEVGKHADFVILDGNPLQRKDANNIHKIKVLGTYIDGKEVVPFK